MPRDDSSYRWWREPDSLRETVHECWLDLRQRRKLPADEPLLVELPRYEGGVTMDEERRRRMLQSWEARVGD